MEFSRNKVSRKRSCASSPNARAKCRAVSKLQNTADKNPLATLLDVPNFPEYIISRLSLQEKFTLSLTSEEIKNVILSKPQVSGLKMDFVATNEEECGIKLSDDQGRQLSFDVISEHRIYWDSTYVEKQNIGDQLFQFCSGRDKFSCQVSDLLPGMGDLFNHLKKMYRPQKIKSVIVSPSFVVDPHQLGSVFDGEVEALHLIGNDPIDLNTVQKFSAYFRPTKSLLIKNQLLGNSKKKLEITSALHCYFTGDVPPELSQLAHFNTKFITIDDSRCTNNDFIDFVKSWQFKGTNSKLEHFFMFHHKECFDRTSIFKALGATPYSSAIRGDLWIGKNGSDKPVFVNCADGYDVTRNDGLLATIKIIGRSLFFVTWEHRFPDTVDGLKQDLADHRRARVAHLMKP